MSGMNTLVGYEWIKTCKICSEDRFVQLTQCPQVNFYRCTRCLVIFLNPQPTLETLKQQYTRQTLLETGPASAWFTHKRYFLRALLRERLRDVLRYRDHGELLDVGCGMGDFCGVAREAGFTVYGTEFSDTYSDHTKQTVGITDIYTGRLQEIDFGTKQFDVITLWHVLEHMPDPLETLLCLKALIKPAGVVAIEVPNAEQNRRRPMYRSDVEDYPLDRLEHLYYYSGRALQNACARAGFTVLGLRYVDAHQPAKNMLKHGMRMIKRPMKQLMYMGRLHRGFSAVRIFLTV